MSPFSFAGLIPLLLVLPAGAQSFNIDAQAGGYGLPPAHYGGPALSPGLWEGLVTSHIQVGFKTVEGVPTNLGIDTTFGCPLPSQYCDDPATSSLDGRLLDDSQRCDASGTMWDFYNLANGQYAIYTIVYHPCGAVAPQRVSVFGSAEGPLDVAATWNGSYVHGENYTRHTKTVTDGMLFLRVWTPEVADPNTGCCGNLSGVQLVRLDEPAPVGIPQCYGNSGGPACPCGNDGLSGHGCQNSAATGGAILYATGTTVPDTVVLNAYGEMPTSLTIFLQGNATVGPLAFGDGLRCAGGILKRLYNKSASGGAVSAPGAGDPSITARSAALGDTIPPGERRYYQTYYRDSNASFCPVPQGSTFNSSHVVKIVW